MPNGDPNWGKKEYPKLEQYFSKISKVLEDFANRHNLQIDKYYHQSPSWTFRFRHPKEGIGQIAVVRQGENSVKIHPGYWLDDYKTGKRFLKTCEYEICSLDKISIKMILEKNLMQILSWDKNDLDRSFENPYREKSKYTKRAIEKDREKYPIPVVDE